MGRREARGAGGPGRGDLGVRPEGSPGCGDRNGDRWTHENRKARVGRMWHKGGRGGQIPGYGKSQGEPPVPVGDWWMPPAVSERRKLC